MSIEQLIAARARAVDAARKIIDEKTDKESGRMSAEDTAAYERAIKDVEDLSASIKRAEDLKAIEDRLSAPTSQPVLGQLGSGAPTDQRRTATDEYRAAFNQFMRRGRPQDLLQEGVGESGGFLVPDQFATEIVNALSDNNVMRQIANVVQCSTKTFVVPTATDGQAHWIGEGETLVENDPTFGQIEINVYKQYRIVPITNEQLEDSAFNMETYIAAEYARTLGANEEAGFVSGDGSGKPFGVFDTTKGGTVNVTTSGATPTAAMGDSIIDLVYSVKGVYRRNASFVMNDNTIAAVRKLKDSSGQYLWQPSLQAGQPDRLYGYPVYSSPAAPIIAAGAPVIAFGDFKFYYIVDRRGITMQRLDQIYSVSSDSIGFKATQRVGGQVVLPEAIGILKMGGSAA
jgi:HK97 family phage major capsid protein